MSLISLCREMFLNRLSDLNSSFASYVRTVNQYINEMMEVITKVAVVPGFAELIITVNPAREVTGEIPASIIRSLLYALWPESQKKEVAEIDVEGETSRVLLTALSLRYRQAEVDFNPISRRTNDLDSDYDVLVNGKNYVAVPNGLDTKLNVR